MTPLVELRGVRAGYGRSTVVRDIDLAACPGEVVALLGPNGAGKTTTLLVAAGLLAPQTGTCRLAGVPVRDAVRAARSGLAFVPDDRALFCELTVRENLRLGARGQRDGMEQALSAVPELGRLLARRAGLLSGGEQQLLAVGRAIAARPGALLVDELSTGLAPLLVRRLLGVLRRLADEHGTAIVVVEQHVKLVLAAADRCVVLRHGERVLEAPAAQLRGRADVLEASYFGRGGTSDVE